MHINRLWFTLLPVLLIGVMYGSAAQTAEPRYKTLPDFPDIITHVSGAAASDGYVFLTPGERFNDFLLILDNNSEPVYYQHAPDNHRVYDFKVQPDGSLTYLLLERVAGAPVMGYQMDNTYTIRNSFVPVGYDLIDMDEHEIQIFPDGSIAFLIQQQRPVDMTGVITGGLPNAIAVDTVIQLIDADNNLLFEWDGGDFYDIDDTLEPWTLTDQTIDYTHGNSIERDQDGNLILSNRNLSEVTKIDRETGEIIWRMGGNHNEFTLIGDDNLFTYQHDARRVSADTITIFDNIRDYDRLGEDNSRVLEYRLDEENKTIELIWEYEHPGGVWSRIMGNAQRQENGNTMIGWGSGGYAGDREKRLFSEVSADGDLLFDVEIKNHGSYRAFRSDWTGYPTEPPTLIVESENDNIHLYYSWNGATEVVKYNVYSGVAPDTLSRLTVQEKTGFEETTVITSAVPSSTSYYQVVPLDAAGNELTPSSIISATVPPTAVGLSTVNIGVSTPLMWMGAFTIVVAIFTHISRKSLKR